MMLIIHGNMQKAYVDAYQALSEKRVGLLGKHNSTFRSLKRAST